MCSIDILESMVSISSIINKLSLDRFELFNKNNLMLLGKVEFASSEGKEKHDVKLSEPDDDIYNSVKDVFLKIISLTSKDDSPAIRESVHKYLSLLGNAISGFPGYKKSFLDKETQEMITEAIERAKNYKDENLRIDIIRCKNIIYKES